MAPPAHGRLRLRDACSATTAATPAATPARRPPSRIASASVAGACVKYLIHVNEREDESLLGTAGVLEDAAPRPGEGEASQPRERGPRKCDVGQRGTVRQVVIEGKRRICAGFAGHGAMGAKRARREAQGGGRARRARKQEAGAPGGSPAMAVRAGEEMAWTAKKSHFSRRSGRRVTA